MAKVNLKIPKISPPRSSSIRIKLPTLKIGRRTSPKIPRLTPLTLPKLPKVRIPRLK